MSKFVNLEKIIFMRLKTWVTTLLALAVFSAGLTAAPAGGPRSWQQAMRLYEDGLYEQARILFEAMPDGPLLKEQSKDSSSPVLASRTR